MDNDIVKSARPSVVSRGSLTVTPATEVLMQAGLPANTRRAYAGDRREWAAFCARWGAAVFPMTQAGLADFVAELLTVGSPTSVSPRPLAATSVERRLAALSTWSVEHGHGRPDLRAARLVLRGHRRTQDVATRQAAPVTTGVLRALVADARTRHGVPDAASARALRDSAILLLGFATAARRSELVGLRIQDLREHPEGLQVQMRRRKTTDEAAATAVPWAADPVLCPVRAALAWRAALAARGYVEGPLFRRITRTDAVLAAGLSAESVADVVARVAASAGVAVPDGFHGYSGHSLRRGFATEARRAGADALRIARHGGWADNSASLAKYIADIDRWQGHPLSGVL